MDVPQFSEDSTEQTLAEDDPLSNSPIKGAIKWEKRDGQYVFLWWQTPFYIATENGGYSMTESLLESIPDHLDQIWVVDDKHNKVSRFSRSQYESGEDREVIDPEDDRFENVVPARQIAVDREAAREVHSLEDVDL